MVIGPLPPPIGGATLSLNTLVKRLQAFPNLDVTVINTSRKPGDIVATLYVALRTVLVLLARGKGVDVITFHANSNARKWLGPVICMVARILRRPLIVRAFGGTFDEQFARMPKVHQWILRKTYLNADICLLQTRRLVNFFRGYARRVEWFPNHTHDVGLTERTPFRAQCDKFIFLSRVIRAKGVDTILAAQPMLNRNVTIDIFGPLEGDYSADEINRLGKGQITYRGVLSPHEVDELLWEYDALVLPTRWDGEGYPAVILEAYAHGLPVITTRWQSIPEIVDADCGILIEPGDVQAFAEAVNRLHTDCTLYAHLQRGARERAKMFPEEYWVERFLRICCEVTKRDYNLLVGGPAG